MVHCVGAICCHLPQLTQCEGYHLAGAAVTSSAPATCHHQSRKHKELLILAFFIREGNILNYKRLCPLVPLFGNKCEICLTVKD